MLEKLILLLFTLISMQVLAASSPAPVAIRGFQEWKSDKVQAAFHQMLTVKSQIQRANSDNNRRALTGLYKQLDQIKWNIEASKDLSVTDYFVIYLSQQANPDKFQQAAAKMSTSEVAQLMEAYSNT